jgi:hypothetical protein
VLAARHAARDRRWLALALLCLLLLVPLLVNWRATEGLLKAMPVIGSTSSFVRWLWIYVPIAIVLGARALGSVAIHPRLGPALVPLVLLSLILENKSGYRERVYHEAPITDAWRTLRERGSPPPIENVATSIVAGVRRDDALIAGASAFPCYEPTFGYGLETYPATRLANDSATAEIGGAFNFVDPRCMVWPAELACRPGDRFALGDRAALDDFLAYRNLPVELPRRQRIANWVSALAWIAAGLVLSARPRSGAGRRAASDRDRAS